ncbi:repeat-containing protein [Paenibacillus sp. UNC496MF]|nr:repeat-containing protein [Paenibacillus sp. UNC496MF]
MMRMRRAVSFIIAALLVLQVVIGGLAAGPKRAEAATSGPVIANISPLPSTANVPTNTNLKLTFDENVRKGTGSATIQIRKQLDNALFESYVVATDSRVAIGTGANRNVVTISPSSNFALNTSYYVTIDAGAFANESNNANFAGLTSAVGWSFTTVAAADTTPPALNATNPFSPANGGTAGVGTALKLSFNEPVFAASGSITVQNVAQSWDSQVISVNSVGVSGSSTSTINVTLPNVLNGSSTYEVSVPSGAFQDAAGNPFGGVDGARWRFTTTAPPLGTPVLKPADNAYSVSVTTNLVLSFPGAVAANTGTITINKVADNTTVQTIGANSGSVSYVPNASTGGTDVVIDPPSDLAPNTGFYVLIDGGAFKDAGDSSKLFQGISDARAWSFVTDPGNDTTPPTLLADRKPLGTQATRTVSLEMNFSEPVYPGTGNIVIRSLPSGNAFASIPVTSTKVSGGGTTKITVTDASKTYADNARYYVEIGGQAFSDVKGNYFAGLSGSIAWSFTVTQDSDKPSLVLQVPASGAQNVPLQGTQLEATFSEPIMLGTSGAAITVKRVSGTGNSPLTTTYAIDPNNNRKLLVTVNGTMAGNTDYYAEISPGAVTDLAGNAFDGILNQYGWAFRTSASSYGPPTVTGAALVGTNKIDIAFNENLDTRDTATPAPANFYVTVNGAARSVTNVAIGGHTVTLTLQSAASYGQVIKVSYSAGSNPIKDLDGTAAASFSGIIVTNVPDTTAPYQVSGSLNGTTIVLTFSEEIAQVSSYAYAQFSVYVDGSYRSATSYSSSGSVVFLAFSGAAPASGQTVSVSYYAQSYPLRDLAGNAAANFSNFYVQNGTDRSAPALQYVTAAGSLVTLAYNEALNTALTPPAASFYVTVNGASRSVYSVSVSGSQVLLSLSTAISTGDSVVVTYVGGTPAITDLYGNAASTFSSMPANNGGTSSLVLNGIIAKGGTVTVSFSAALSASYPASTSQFSVKVNNASRPISNASVSGSSVVLSLYTPVAIGDAVKVSYSNAGLGPRSVTGVLPASFTEVGAANQTTWADNASGDYEAAEGGGLGIKSSAAITTSTVSPAGIPANQYALTGEKVTAAYNAVRSVSGTVPRVVFTVPSTENAAIVALPLGALEDAKKLASNASIGVAYKAVTYDIPLSALNFAQLAQMMNAAGPVGQLVVSIDTNAGSLASALNAQLSSAGDLSLVNPVSFQLAVTNNGRTKPVDNLSGYVTRTIKTSANLDGKQVAVVWLDPQTNKLSYVPTQVTQANGQSVVTFKRKGNSVYAVVKGTAKFTDLAKHWARNDIQLLANKYIVEGSTLTAFAPNKAVTRGEFAMFIAKGLGLTGDRSAAAKFKDVNTSAALAAYIGAAATSGIVQGMTDGSFKANNPITREEMATMMVRAAAAAGVQYALKGAAADTLKKFADRGKIGTWAQADVAKAVQAGIIAGQTATSFGGKNKATRAEAAVMVKRLLANVDFLDI